MFINYYPRTHTVTHTHVVHPEAQKPGAILAKREKEMVRNNRTAGSDG